MNTKLGKVVMQVETYFKNYLPEYSVLEVRRKSHHPDDDHLYMVSAGKKKDGTFAVWTNWNEQTQCLNHGHYDLKSVKDCDTIFAEYQNTQQYFAVYKCSQKVRFRLFVTDNEEDARRFCEGHQWEITDVNEFVWSLSYSETKVNERSDKEEI